MNISVAYVGSAFMCLLLWQA